MATIYMSEGDAARDLHAALAKVKQGVEVVIEQDHRPVAVLRAQQRSGRPISANVYETAAFGVVLAVAGTFPAKVPETVKR